jgi:F0F1-type ATP synthase epsilon subunit
MKSNLDTVTMHTKIYSPFVVYFDGDVLSVSAVNSVGPFDILPDHHKLLTLLNKCDVVVRLTNGKTKEIPINGGVMHVKNNQTTIFLDV